MKTQKSETRSRPRSQAERVADKINEALKADARTALFAYPNPKKWRDGRKASVWASIAMGAFSGDEWVDATIEWVGERDSAIDDIIDAVVQAFNRQHVCPRMGDPHKVRLCDHDRFVPCVAGTRISIEGGVWR